jgi:hypothetical protein
MDYAPSMLTNLIKGGDVRKEKGERFLGFGTNEAIDFGKLNVSLKDAKFIKGGLSYVKNERTERFYVD